MSGSGLQASRKSGVLGRPSWKSVSGWEAIPDIREGSRGPPKCSGVVGRPCRKFVSGRGPTRKSVSGLEALPNVR